MPISDLYVVQYLLQETQTSPPRLIWTDRQGDSYDATLHGIEVKLFSLASRAGSRFHITLTHFPERIDISEPINKGLFRLKYDTEDDQRLVYLIRSLADAVSRQCTARSNRSPEGDELVRELIYRRLIGSEGSSG